MPVGIVDAGISSITCLAFIPKNSVRVASLKRLAWFGGSRSISFCDLGSGPSKSLGKVACRAVVRAVDRRHVEEGTPDSKQDIRISNSGLWRVGIVVRRAEDGP